MKSNDCQLKKLIEKRENSLKWHQSSHEIVKYLPENYNEEGCYLKKEWTSMWDIGRYIEGRLVTKQDYMAIENHYIDVALGIMKESGCSLMTVVFWGGRIKSVVPSLMKKSPLGENDINLYASFFGLKSGSRVSLEKAAGLIRLSLREWKCFYLVNISHKLQIDIGYDYYMHVYSKLSNHCIREIVESNHLFLDPRSSVPDKRP